MPDRVRITDVSPRDGLQNEPAPVPTALKIRLVRALCEAGVDEVEVSSFVSKAWVPQLGDAAEVFRGLIGVTAPRPVFSALVPNARGMDDALRLRAEGCPIDKVAVFTAATETFSLRNTNATLAQTLERFRPVIAAARGGAGGAIPVRGYVSCAIACPFEGPVAPARVAAVAAMLLDLGVDEIDLGDTIGAGTPASVRAMLEAVSPRVAEAGATLTLHLHDTFGRAEACLAAALEAGVRSFDGSVAGLGGCPYAGTPQNPAPGNVSTELLVRAARRSGLACGVRDEALSMAAAVAREVVAGARRGPR